MNLGYLSSSKAGGEAGAPFTFHQKVNPASGSKRVRPAFLGETGSLQEARLGSQGIRQKPTKP